MKATCPNCGSQYDVEGAGKYECPSCGGGFEVKPSTPAKVKLRNPAFKDTPFEKKKEGSASSVPLCPWCQSPLPKRMSEGTWACPSCQHLYKAKGEEVPERVFRVFPLNNLDAGLTRRGILVWCFMIVALIVIYLFSSILYAQYERRSYSRSYYSY